MLRWAPAHAHPHPARCSPGAAELLASVSVLALGLDPRRMAQTQFSRSFVALLSLERCSSLCGGSTSCAVFVELGLRLSAAHLRWAVVRSPSRWPTQRTPFVVVGGSRPQALAPAASPSPGASEHSSWLDPVAQAQGPSSSAQMASTQLQGSAMARAGTRSAGPPRAEGPGPCDADGHPVWRSGPRDGGQVLDTPRSGAVFPHRLHAQSARG